MMYGHEKSDLDIVARKPTNEAGRPGGAKGEDQGECGPAKHVPGAEPGKRDTGAGAHTESRKRRRTTCRHTPEVGAAYGSGAARLAAIPAGASPASRGVQSLL